MEPESSDISDRPDDALMMQIAQGSKAAFGELYDKFATPLYSLALKMLRNETEAQDLLQEIFLSVWNKASTYRAERGSAFSWVVTQLRNRAIDKIRSSKRRSELMEDFGHELESWGTEILSAADNVERSERGQRIRLALTQINAEQRQALMLAYFSGLSQSEIAERLNEPLGTIKARTHRGLARLREILRSRHA